MKPFRLHLVVCLMLLFSFTLSSNALGVLTHEAIVDAAWDTKILPLLNKKYPGGTPDELKEAHAYTYGGAVAPDMGYYPRGSKFFTDLVHYVRSGDMVTALIKNAETRNQFAFALGFLAHYYADRYGHPLATNKSVPLVYTKVGRKFGNNVTYADDELSHMRMEFGFDVLEVAKGNFASQSYREYIGFKVDTSVLSRSFREVYGLEIEDVYGGHFHASVEMFRWVVANIFPLITRQAWATKKAAIQKADSTATAERFNIRMRQRNYDKAFGKEYMRPGFFPTIVSFFIRILPKVGPLRALKFKIPTAETEKLFTQSFDTILHHYTTQITSLGNTSLSLADIDFDTGAPTHQCEYTLADEAYARLLASFDTNRMGTMPPDLRNNLLSYFKNLSIPAALEKHCLSFYQSLQHLRNTK